ncbi:hypothetical protein MnTg01_00313 [archaeon MnTg01]|nr:hypothetical protein MnTg01_00313 [archaeon MnTg01]
MIERGVLANFLIVVFVPFLLMSLPYTMLILEPSGRLASITGLA